MEILGIILLLAGGVLWFVRSRQQQRSSSLKLAHTPSIQELQEIAAAVAADIGGGDWRDYVVLWGTVQPETPLISPLKQVACAYYKSSVTREYEETIQEQDSRGKWVTRTQRGSETVSQQSQQTDFHLVDSAGDRILVNPTGATIEAVEILHEFRPGQPAGGQLAFGQFVQQLGMGGAGRTTLGYRYREVVVPVGQAMSVLGMATDGYGPLTTGDRTLAIEKPSHGGQPFIISPKSHEALTQAASRNAQIAFWAMVSCLGLGGVLLLVGLIS
jgi:hypothetical protein